MDEAKIYLLTGKCPQDVAAQVQSIVRSCMTTLETKLERTLTWPTVTYDLKGRTAGQAETAPTNNIRLNLELLLNENHQSEMLGITLPHEVAHIVQYQLWPDSKAHGREWQLLMHMLSLPAHRCHNMQDYTPARRTRKFEYTCDCGAKYVIGLKRHRDIQLHGRGFSCRYDRKPLYDMPWEEVNY